jgi:WD40 repeat protein
MKVAILIVFGFILGSPLDQLDPAKVEDAPPGSPKELVAILPGHTRAVTSLAFSPAGDVLASASWDNTTRLWRFGKATPTFWTTLPGSPSSVAFTPNGKELATGSSGTSIHLWDLAQEPPKIRETLAGHKNRPFTIVFAPNGKMLVSGCNEPVLRLWKLGDGEPEAWGVLANESVPSLGISSLAISKDSKFLAAGSFAGERTLRLWNLAGNFLEELDLPKARARLVAFAPTGNLLAFAGEEATITLWAVAKDKLQPLRTLAGHPRKGPLPAVQTMAFSPDGRRLVSCGQERKVILWEVDTGKKMSERVFSEDIRATAFAPDGRHLALGTAEGLVYLLRL